MPRTERLHLDPEGPVIIKITSVSSTRMGREADFYIFPEHSDMKVWLELGSKEDLRVTSRLALFLLFSKKKRGEVSDKLFPMLKKRHHQESTC